MVEVERVLTGVGRVRTNMPAGPEILEQSGKPFLAAVLRQDKSYDELFAGRKITAKSEIEMAGRDFSRSADKLREEGDRRSEAIQRLNAAEAFREADRTADSESEMLKAKAALRSEAARLILEARKQARGIDLGSAAITYIDSVMILLDVGEFKSATKIAMKAVEVAMEGNMQNKGYAASLALIFAKDLEGKGYKKGATTLKFKAASLHKKTAESQEAEARYYTGEMIEARPENLFRKATRSRLHTALIYEGMGRIDLAKKEYVKALKDRILDANEDQERGHFFAAYEGHREASVLAEKAGKTHIERVESEKAKEMYDKYIKA